MRGQERESAGKAEILPEAHHLHGVRRNEVEEKRREHGEPGKGERDRAGEEAREDGEAAEEFERDGRPGEEGRNAPGCHVAGEPGDVLQLAIAGGDEEKAEEDARHESGAGLDRGHSGLRVSAGGDAWTSLGSARSRR